MADSKSFDQLVAELRSKVVPATIGEKPNNPKTIDKQTVWRIAKKAGKTISDDALFSKPLPKY